MFFLRSAFWLILAFMVMAPHGVDLGAVKDQAISAGFKAGQELIVGQILSASPAGANVIDSTPSADLPMQDSSKRPFPFPRPRPDWMG
jgi:hypothetical protein